MARPLTELGSLGAEVAAALEQDGGQRALAIEEARQRFSAGTARPRSTRAFAPPLAWVMAAATVLVALGWLSFARRPLQFNVDGKTGVAQSWLAAPASRPVVVAFSDGTVLDVAPSSRARVVDTDQNGASISLESGAIEAKVVHTSHSAWRLIAGPFAVRVTGTRFDVHWNPASQQFSLAVLEGSVVVSGSIIGSERPVRAGEKLLASVVQGRLELLSAEAAAATRGLERAEPARPSAELAGGAAAAAPATADAPAAPSVGPTPSPDASDKAASAPLWRELAKRGDLRRAFAAAEAHGFQAACDAASSSELLLLGDAARVSGRSDRATDALLALRRRYPRDPRRAAAAFALGKVAFDQRHAYGQAAEWFGTSVREQPSGPLAREASGREIEALRSAGKVAAAAASAQRYLARYPDGPHAEVARSVLK